MNFQKNELTAYSVQECGAAWKWRVYGAGGQVVLQGVALSQVGAECAALALFCQPRARLAA